MIHGKVTLQLYTVTQHDKVKGRTLSPDGIIVGTFNDNNILNDLTRDVEFEDGDVREHMAKATCENMLTRTDVAGHSTMVLKAMLNHRTNETEYELKDKYFRVNN